MEAAATTLEQCRYMMLYLTPRFVIAALEAIAKVKAAI